jgi:hypothetical protein
MAQYMIEVTHDDDVKACLAAIEVFLKTGSHYLTHCDWGCSDGIHKAWIKIEAGSKDDALRVVPPAFRSRATATLLDKFSLEQVQSMLAEHKG